MRAHLAYLIYVLRHKWFVFLACFKMHVPIWQAIAHDWDKFLPDEWFPYVHAFYKSDGSKQRLETPAFAQAWNAHQKRNKHHWQFWLLVWDRGETTPLEMPEVHLREMLADWIGAGRAISNEPDPTSWYLKNRDKMKLHPKTRNYVEAYLGLIDWRPIGMFPGGKK